MRLGLAYSGMFPVPELVEIARAADGGPIGSVWTLEHLGYRDAFVPAAAILAASRDLTVVPTAVSPYARNPMLVAMQTAALAELAPGRVELVLAVGNAMAYRESGMDQRRPLSAVAEYLDLLRAIWAGERVRWRGSEFTADGSTFHVPVEPRLPVHVAAMRDRMLGWVGAAADGVLLSAGLTLAGIRRALDVVEDGAKGVGRLAPPSFAGIVLIAVGASTEEAVEEARGMVSYLFRARARSGRVADRDLPVDLEALAEAWERRDLEAARALVPDEAVVATALVGSAAECRAGLRRYLEAGLDAIVLLPVGGASGARRVVDAFGLPTDRPRGSRASNV